MGIYQKLSNHRGIFAPRLSMTNAMCHRGSFRWILKDILLRLLQINIFLTAANHAIANSSLEAGASEMHAPLSRQDK